MTLSDEEMEFEMQQAQAFSGEGNKNSGHLVKTKKGLEGRTYHNKGLVRGKVPVYLVECHICGGQGEHTSDCGATIGGFSMVSDRAILCEQESLKVIGFID